MLSIVRPIHNLIAWLGIALLTVFTLVEKGPSRSLQWPWYLYAQLLALSPVLWLLGQIAHTRRLPRLGAQLHSALLAFAAAMTAAALLSPYRPATLAMLPIVLVPIATAYAIAQWLEDDPENRRRRALENGGALFLTAATAMALFGWLLNVVRPLYAQGIPLPVSLGGRNEWLLGHTVYVAGLGLLEATWLAGLARERRGVVRLACLGGALLGLATLFSTASRSGFIGLGLWLVWLVVHEVRQRRWPLARTVMAGCTLAALALGLALIHPRIRQMVSEWRSSSTLNMGDRQRLAMAEFGGLVLYEHPLLGIGPGATPSIYGSYRARLSGGVETALQLHSTPVQWAADAGCLGLAAAALAIFALWRRRRHEVPTFAAGTLLAYAGLSLTDYQLDIPLFAFVTGILLGLCASTCPQSGQPQVTGAPPRSIRWALPTAALVVLLIAYGLSQVNPHRARAAFAEAIEALSAGDREAFETGMAETHRLAPREPFYYNLHACLLANSAAYPLWFPAIELGADRLPRAEALLLQSLDCDPQQELPHNHLAWYLLATRPEQAAQHFRAAFRLQPDKASLYYGFALAALHRQDPQLAAQALAMELINDPSFISSPEWAQLEHTQPGITSKARQAAASELEHLAATAAPADPLRYARRARYAAALLRWLDGMADALEPAQAAAEPTQAAILVWLAGQPTQLPSTPTAAWQWLALACVRPTDAPALLAARYAGALPDDRVVADLLSTIRATDRRELVLGTAAAAQQHPPRIYRERVAYPLLQRNLDAPAPRDPYLPPVNRIVRDFLSPLFPEKGYLPGPVLIDAQADLGLERE